MTFTGEAAAMGTSLELSACRVWKPVSLMVLAGLTPTESRVVQPVEG
jgi:hypothetical protein